MGGGGGGKGSGLTSITNPMNLIVGKDHWAARNFDPAGRIAEQSLRNTANVITGKESFGSHKNWVGRGLLGDVVDPMM